MARTPDLKRHAFWRECIGRQAESGLTIAHFCAREGLGVFTFKSWKRRFRVFDRTDHRPALSAPSAFLPVAVRVAERSADSGTPGMPIEADLPNGIRLRIPTSNARLACRLVRAVAGAKTRPGGSR
jgi:hypothetical protein